MDIKAVYDRGVAELESNFESAWEKINLAAANRYEPAMLTVAMMYYRGDYVELNEKYALEKFYEIIRLYPNNGYVYARIAECYFLGYGTEENDKKALEYYLKAWEKGYQDNNSNVATRIGILFHDNRVYDEAAKWYQRAADGGCPEGKHFLAGYYEFGMGGLPVNKKLAYKYWVEAAQDGFVLAIKKIFHKFVYDYNFLDIKEDDDEKICNAMIKYAEQGEPEIQKILGDAYRRGKHGFEKNYEKAKQWYELALQNGNREAFLPLGQMLVNSYYNMVNYSLGEQYLIACAQEGNGHAMNELHSHFRYEDYKTGWKGDPEKAFYWAVRAVESGEKHLNETVASYYFNGYGTEKDLRKAAYYYEMCVEDLGFFEFLSLAKCYLQSQGLTNDYRKVYQYLLKAQEMSSQYSSINKGEIEYWLAYMYEKGLFVSKDYGEAYIHYAKSAELGFEKALDELKCFKKGILGWKKYS